MNRRSCLKFLAGLAAIAVVGPRVAEAEAIEIGQVERFRFVTTDDLQEMNRQIGERVALINEMTRERVIGITT